MGVKVCVAAVRAIKIKPSVHRECFCKRVGNPTEGGSKQTFRSLQSAITGSLSNREQEEVGEERSAVFLMVSVLLHRDAWSFCG